MTDIELANLVSKANDSTELKNTLADAMKVLAAMFESMSKGKKETKTILDRIEGNLDEMGLRVQRMERHCSSPIWGAVVGDPEDDLCPCCGHPLPQEEEDGADDEEAAPDKS